MANFCCCLPLRLGTLLIALFQFLFNAAGAIVLWLVLFATQIPKSWYDNVQINGQNIQPPDIHLPTVQKVFVIVSAVVLTLGALFSLFGFIGALIKKLSFVNGFVRVLSLLLGFHLGTGVANIVVWAVKKDAFINDCIQELSANPDLKDVQDDACKVTYRAVLIAFIVVTVVPLLLDLYALWVVRDYSKELQTKAYSKTAFNLTAPVDMSYKYAPAGTKEEGAVPLTHDQFSAPYSNEYPYAQPQHSYGQTYSTPYSK